MDVAVENRPTNRNANLHNAANNQNDEFYTRLGDIGKELAHYKEHFREKVVFCNCDDPEWSNFWKYFINEFDSLGLKAVISTHYNKDGSASYSLTYNGKETLRTELKDNGDFRSDECIELLKSCDIVVTNPPFSNQLPSSLISLCLEHNKGFILVGELNWITYKAIYPLFKDEKIWYGYNGITTFIQPDNTEAKFGNKLWITNLDIPKRHESLVDTLLNSYEKHKDLYNKYENFDAIDVPTVNDIPYDYYEIMGVPITYLQKHNPDEFEIVGYGSGSFGKSIGVTGYKKEHLSLLGNTAPVEGNLYYIKSDGTLKTPYKRILIKRKGT